MAPRNLNDLIREKANDGDHPQKGQTSAPQSAPRNRHQNRRVTKAQLEKEVGQLQTQLGEAQTQIAALTEQLNAKPTAIAPEEQRETSAKTQALEAEIATLTQQLNDRDQTLKSLAQKADALDRIQAELTTKQDTIDQLTQALQEAQQSPAAETSAPTDTAFVVKPPAPPLYVTEYRAIGRPVTANNGEINLSDDVLGWFD